MNLSPWKGSRRERARSSWAGITHLTMKPFKNVAWILWVTEGINLVWISWSLSWSLTSLVVGSHPREVQCTVEIWETLTDFRGTQRKAWDIVIQNIICSSELARMCGISYISQLGSVKNTHLTARNSILQRNLTARSSNKKTKQNKKTYQPARRHFKCVLRQTLTFRALMTQIYKRRKYYRLRPKDILWPLFTRTLPRP